MCVCVCVCVCVRACVCVCVCGESMYNTTISHYITLVRMKRFCFSICCQNGCNKNDKFNHLIEDITKYVSPPLREYKLSCFLKCITDMTAEHFIDPFLGIMISPDVVPPRSVSMYSIQHRFLDYLHNDGTHADHFLCCTFPYLYIVILY